jgi:ABC-type lipoprotein release transport system permease subunit
MVHYGLDLSGMTSGVSFGGVGVEPVIHGVITVQGLVMPTLILGAMCFLAAFYPAVRAARMRPAQGMREV